MHTLKPVWFRRIEDYVHQGLKPSIYIPERSRGLESPLPRTKVGAGTKALYGPTKVVP
jgi:hypothetical protein